jgi:hypothetical protein
VQRPDRHFRHDAHKQHTNVTADFVRVHNRCLPSQTEIIGRILALSPHCRTLPGFATVEMHGVIRAAGARGENPGGFPRLEKERHDTTGFRRDMRKHPPPTPEPRCSLAAFSAEKRTTPHYATFIARLLRAAPLFREFSPAAAVGNVPPHTLERSCTS